MKAALNRPGGNVALFSRGGENPPRIGRVPKRNETRDIRHRSRTMSYFLRAFLPACGTLIAALGPVPALRAQDRIVGELVERKGDGVYNVIEGETTILSIKPDGSLVKKGELVCELDPALVRQKLT